MVEEWSDNHVQWGNMDPATKKFHKVVVKDAEVINATRKLEKKMASKTLLFYLPAHRP